MSNARIKMTVSMNVTEPQALALQAMFKCWNSLASMGSSRMVGFYVDGDGNFKPKCEWSFSEPIPELTEDLQEAGLCKQGDKEGAWSDIAFDFDGMAWKLRELRLE
jgi:hypothetical protein